ncbi:MAG: DUF4164 family protein [Rhodospirillaceae bacterium]
MNQPTALHKPTRLQQAQARLDSALTSLEAAAARRAAAAEARGDEPVDDGRVQALESELAEARRRNAQLQDVNGRVAGRLDAVIHRLKLAVGD